MPLKIPVTRNYTIENFSGNIVLTADDQFKLLRAIDNGGAQTVTVPPDVFGNGVQISFARIGTSTLTIVAGLGVTINSPTPNLSANAQFNIITVIQDDPANPNIWLAAGALTP